MEVRVGYVWVPLDEWLQYDVVNPRGPISLPAEYLVKHHTPGINPQTFDAAVQALNNIWYYHTYVAEGGWGWIGYNTVGWSRYIFEGAGLGNRGIHAPGANGQSHGHAFLLDGQVRQPTTEEWTALRYLMGDAVAQGYMHNGLLVTNSFRNTNHSDWVSTSCPSTGVGESAYKFYEVTVEPNPDSSRKVKNIVFKPRLDRDGTPFKWPPGAFGFEGGAIAYDASVPGGSKIGVAPGQQHYREINVRPIINGIQQNVVAASEGSPYFLSIDSDSFVTFVFSADVIPNISVG